MNKMESLTIGNYVRISTDENYTSWKVVEVKGQLVFIKPHFPNEYREDLIISVPIKVCIITGRTIAELYNNPDYAKRKICERRSG